MSLLTHATVPFYTQRVASEGLLQTFIASYLHRLGLQSPELVMQLTQKIAAQAQVAGDSGDSTPEAQSQRGMLPLHVADRVIRLLQEELQHLLQTTSAHGSVRYANPAVVPPEDYRPMHRQATPALIWSAP